MIDQPITHTQACPCGRSRLLDECCLPLIKQERNACTAEDLMRSRYTAHVMMNTAYLLHTWHSSRRPDHLSLPQPTEMKWIRLEVHSTQDGTLNNQEGIVDYTALSRSTTGLEWLKETARFARESGQWRYLDGVFHPAPKIGRNSPCPCLSGIKYKRCCYQ